MLYTVLIFNFLLLPLVLTMPHINLYYTDWINRSDYALQYNCFRVSANIEFSYYNRQIMSYCMNEFSSQVLFEKRTSFPKFTFSELAERNITSQQLYLWSASIESAENYQVYLNGRPTSSTKEFFHNCTLPRFGPFCQFEFDYYHPNHSSLYEIIHDFYHSSRYAPTNLTCYTHLKCTTRSYSLCLDWTDICDGKVDCLDSEIDEEDCWQLDTNQCHEQEFQCMNGQCIPESYFNDDLNFPDCLDGSDETGSNDHRISSCTTSEPSFECEDITCKIAPLTASCVSMRGYLLLRTLFSFRDSLILDDCWHAFLCVMNLGDLIDFNCNSFCDYETCVTIIENECPDMLFIPAVPVLFGQIYFAYHKNDSHSFNTYQSQYPHVCSNDSRYDAFFVNATKIIFNNLTCYYRHDITDLWDVSSSWEDRYLRTYKSDLWAYNEVWRSNQTTKCNRSNIYQCHNSPKCISFYEKNDEKRDCPYGDDENRTEMANSDSTDEFLGIPLSPGSRLRRMFRYIREVLSFQTICDGFPELAPVNISGRRETDETECEQWPCTNIYTRCDGIWNCPNGVDELGCNAGRPLNCSPHHHICVSSNTTELTCLPIEKANDGQIDCMGATDEPRLCRSKYQPDYRNSFYCKPSVLRECVSYDELCDDEPRCRFGDDEKFCQRNRTVSISNSICLPENIKYASDAEKFLCHHVKNGDKPQRIYFSLVETNKTTDDGSNDGRDTAITRSSLVPESIEPRYGCHRGLPVHIWLNRHNTQISSTCLCPPSSYGSRCQFQNQRVSFSIEFRGSSDSWQTPFAILISLIDHTDQRTIHSYEQTTYLSMRDCETKFHIYLTYATRGKDRTTNYSVHIDIYEKISLTYRGSLLFPITFPFLPVYRLATIGYIPEANQNKKLRRCSKNPCKHGTCTRYSNTFNDATFCQCHAGWTGRYCTTPHTCGCAQGSLCLGVSASHQSICLCSVHKFGPRCLLTTPLCQTAPNPSCQNNGQCLPNDDYMISNRKFTCICPNGFSGDRCEIVDSKLVLSFDKDFLPSQSIRIHFIQTRNNAEPIRITTLKTIPVKLDSITVFWSQVFHLIFLELLNNTYYLIAGEKTYSSSMVISKTASSLDRCRNITEVLNETIVQLHPLRRIKYFHLPCQNVSDHLPCFHDEIHLCLCYDFHEQRLANCFLFDHNEIYHCHSNDCENGAGCYQDTRDCPKRLICVCPPCYYGARCQFSARGYGLSLDAILGYHILPQVSFNEQPFITQITFALTIIFLIGGFLNGTMSVITFKSKTTREVGCGVYLLGSSIVALLTMLVFGMKFFTLLLAQMTVISNRPFLNVQCICLDFMLRICLFTDQWLHACVGVERAIMTLKGHHFRKQTSQRAAKYVIALLIFTVISTCIHDPLSRRLIDEGNDDDQKRIWCIVTYSFNLNVYDSVIHIFHFVGPFLVNFVSAIVLIITKSRQQSNLHQQRHYKEHLREQFQQHKHLVSTPTFLIILAIPRLIILFVSKCMTSVNDSWLYLLGYFISFIPSVLTFMIFVLPSEFYQTEFRKSFSYYRIRLQRCCRCIP